MVLLNEFAFGSFIQARRLQLELTVDELAQRTGLPLGEVELYEDGMAGEPTVSALVVVADVLEVRVADLVLALGYE